MVFQCINIRQLPREVLKTAASGLGFQHLPQDLANVNTWKTMFDPYNDKTNAAYEIPTHKQRHTAREEPPWDNSIVSRKQNLLIVWWRGSWEGVRALI